jgi:phosphatidylserine decarboxylase
MDRLKVLPQYLLPQHGISRCLYALTRCSFKPGKNAGIRWFIGHYGVDMSIAEHSDPEAYPTFNAFFTRALKAGARPIDPNPSCVVSPVDGAVSQCGDIKEDRLFQAKSHVYTLKDLVAGDSALADKFRNGSFATLYLSPRDYHRIHMPVDGRVVKQIYVPGRLFAVNTYTARVVPRLFARNERVILEFDTALGPFVLILVGALNVGSMETVWTGQVTPSSQRQIRTWEFAADDPATRIQRGAEVGRFNMGSTVILLAPAERLNWLSDLTAGRAIKMGEAIGRLLAS